MLGHKDLDRIAKLLIMLGLIGMACAAPAATYATMTATAAAVPSAAMPNAIRPTGSPYPFPFPTLAVCSVRTGSPAGTVWIRAGPGMIYPAIGLAREGDLLSLTGQASAGWVEIKMEELRGWFYAPTWCGD
jgi:uncharacterized protein YraI